MALLDYNIETKQLKINIYMPHYNELKQFDDLKSNIDWIVMQIIGEIIFGKNNELPRGRAIEVSIGRKLIFSFMKT